MYRRLFLPEPVQQIERVRTTGLWPFLAAERGMDDDA